MTMKGVGGGRVMSAGRLFALLRKRVLPNCKKRYLAQKSSPTTGIQQAYIRNVGIIAHIDAGKTTTTERMLFYSGLTDEMGEVHDGDTITDYMEQERERGITITSAAVTFPWKKHRINLIDTPGHVDFTVEVERSLSVLDGSVVVLDASAGVEAQTVTVWSQADRHSVPKIVYLNKMDKNTANVDMCLKSIQKLGSRPLLLQLPIKFGAKDFRGVVDIIRMEKLIWSLQQQSDGTVFESTPLDSREDMELFEAASEKRESLIASLADNDDDLSTNVLEASSTADISPSIIIPALRKATIAKHFVPVMMGSSYKNVGVQLLMDSILTLLPSPLEVEKKNTTYFKDHFCGLAFKVIHHKTLGALTFIRIYTGEIKPSTKIFNLSRNRMESIIKLYIACADEFKEVPILSAGNIIVATGLECVTGDTLASIDFMKKRSSPTNEEPPLPPLPGPSVPDPVFFCSIEAPSPSKQNPLENALKSLCREDPSLHVATDDSGQLVLSGMGELHIDIIKDRLLKEYDIDAFLGPLQVSYREGIQNEVSHSVDVTKLIGGVRNTCRMKLMLKPIGIEEKNQFKVHISRDNNLGTLRPDWLKAIESGVDSGLYFGPLLSFPILGVRTELHEFETTNATSHAFISATASSCVAAALKNASMTLLEPLMRLEISVPVSYSNRIITDLSGRRSQISNVSERNSLRVISCLTPLSELVKFSSDLRSLSSGTASLHMEFATYQKMSEAEKRMTIEKVTGFFSKPTKKFTNF